MALQQIHGQVGSGLEFEVLATERSASGRGSKNGDGTILVLNSPSLPYRAVGLGLSAIVKLDKRCSTLPVS